jgi:hypothetical protein
VLNAKTWDRVYWNADEGQVSKGKPHDFSFEVKLLGYTEGAEFKATHIKATTAADFTESDRLAGELHAARLVESKRRAEIAKRAEESQAGIDLEELAVPDALVKLLTRYHIANKEAHGRFVAAVPSGWIDSVFANYIRNVEGLSIDGVPATTGSTLLLICDDSFVSQVLRLIHHGSALSEAEGKVSSSRSISPQEGEATPSIEPGV